MKPNNHMIPKDLLIGWWIDQNRKVQMLWQIPLNGSTHGRSKGKSK